MSPARRQHCAVALAALAFLPGCVDNDDSQKTARIAAPSLTSQPARTIVGEGATATFVVAALGVDLRYQWYRDGSAIPGATYSSHTIDAVTPDDAGDYHVVVSSWSRPTTSRIATLTVPSPGAGGGEPWDFVTGANPEDLVENTPFDFTVQIDLAAPALSTSSARLLAGSESAGVTPLLLDGTEVVTVTKDAFGMTIDASALPDDVRIAYALTGTYSGSLTFIGQSRLKIVLNGVAIDSPDGPALNIQSGNRTFIELGGTTTNVLTDTTTWSDRFLPDGKKMDLKATLFAEGALVFSGDGSLSITAASRHAIASDRHVRVRSGALALSSAMKDGIRANDAFVMDGGHLDIGTDPGAGKGIKVEGREDVIQPLGFIAINDGTIDINAYDKAMTASWKSSEDGKTATTTDDPDPRITINGGTLTIATYGTPYDDRDPRDGDDSLSPEGIESKSVLTINGGDIRVTTTDDALNAGTAIIINGGRILANSTTNDGLDANGPIMINGGLLVAEGAEGAEGGVDCDAFAFRVTGGTFIGYGGQNSLPVRALSTQNSVALRGVPASTLLVIKDASDAVAFAFLVPKRSRAILLGSPALATGSTYKVQTGGAIDSYSENFHGLYLDATSHSGGLDGAIFTIRSPLSVLP